MSSHDCSIKADLKIAPEHGDQAVSYVESFVKEKGLHDNNVQELHFDEATETLSIYVDLYGNGGMRDDDVQLLAEQLGALVTEPGVIEFVDHDTSGDSEDALTCYWVGSDESAKRQARVRYGLKKLRDWVHPEDFADFSVLDGFKRTLLRSLKDAPKADAPQFALLPQSTTVADLLSAAKNALPLLFGPASERLEASIRAFEDATTPTSWDLGDVEQQGTESMCLSDAERRDVLWRFAGRYECTETDWMRMASCVEKVVQERQPGRHIKVVLEDQTVHYAPVDKVDRALRKDTSELDEAINIALGLDEDTNHREVDCTHHYDAQGQMID